MFTCLNETNKFIIAHKAYITFCSAVNIIQNNRNSPLVDSSPPITALSTFFPIHIFSTYNPNNLFYSHVAFFWHLKQINLKRQWGNIQRELKASLKK